MGQARDAIAINRDAGFMPGMYRYFVHRFRPDSKRPERLSSWRAAMLAALHEQLPWREDRGGKEQRAWRLLLLREATKHLGCIPKIPRREMQHRESLNVGRVEA
jgi:hypothetical protein